MARILVTGGAGFIGSFLVDELVKQGHFVRIFDNLDQQVHLDGAPEYLNEEAEFIKGDVYDYDSFKNVIKDIDVVFHQAAVVGIGQSMYKIKHYVSVNTLGTANLLDVLVNHKHDVKKVIVAASMSSYGEGSYLNSSGELIRPGLRTEEQLAAQEWELKDPKSGEVLKPVGIKEDDYRNCNSIYAITKKDQEDMVLTVCKAYGIPAVSLRYFNVYGPRQSLSNPYTGVTAIFMSRIKNDNQPVVNEDGLQTRDFVSVHDIVNANILAMENTVANYEVFNVGTGNPITIKQVAETLAKLYGKDIKPNIINKFRKGDVRHCFADISKIRNKLNWQPKITFEQGMKELIEWSKNAKSKDLFEKASKELKDRGLL